MPLTASDTPACLAIAVKAIEKPTRSTYAVKVARKQAATMRWRAYANSQPREPCTPLQGDKRGVQPGTEIHNGAQAWAGYDAPFSE